MNSIRRFDTDIRANIRFNIIVSCAAAGGLICRGTLGLAANYYFPSAARSLIRRDKVQSRRVPQFSGPSRGSRPAGLASVHLLHGRSNGAGKQQWRNGGQPVLGLHLHHS
jgi:hypothetical protein